MKFIEKKLEHELNVSKTHPLKEFFIYFSGVLFISLISFFLLGNFVDIFVDNLPKKHLRTMNNLLIQGTQKIPMAKQSTEEQRIQKILDKLVASSHMNNQKFTLKIQKGESMNAFAYPANIIVLLRPTIDAAKTENELAMVLGHELGHYSNYDHLKGMGRNIIFLGMSLLFFGQNNSITEFFKSTMDTVSLKFNRHQEQKADSFGLDLLNKTYGHVEEAETFFTKMNLESPSGQSWMSKYMETHPDIEVRIKRLRNMSLNRGYKLKGEVINLN